MSSITMSGIQKPNKNSDGESHDIRYYLRLLWKWLGLIILIALIAAAAAFFISKQLPSEYESSTKLLVFLAPSNQPTSYDSILTSQQLIRTYSEMLKDEYILQEVINQMGLTMFAADLAKKITISPILDTQLMTITISGTDPVLIANIANKLVSVLINMVKLIHSDSYSNSEKSLQFQLDEVEKSLQETKNKLSATKDLAEKNRLETLTAQYQQIYTNLLMNLEQVRLAEVQNTLVIVQVNPAKPSLVPVRPNAPLIAFIAAVLAVLLTTGAIFTIDAYDDTIQTPQQITEALGLPVLGVILNHKNNAGPISFEAPGSAVTEAFRSFRTNILYSDVDNPLRTLLITSPSPKEGKTLICSNLAIVLAQGGKNVITVDADLRRPELHNRLNVPNTFGLTSMLLHPETIVSSVMRKTKVDGLFAITSGNLPNNPAELLGSHKMKQVLEKIKEQADIIVIDTPAVLPVTDAVALAPMVDGVLLVVQPGKTRLLAARVAIDQLRWVNAKLIGVIINNLNPKKTSHQFLYQKNSHYYKGNYNSKTNSEEVSSKAVN